MNSQELREKSKGVGRFMSKLARREFPCHGRDYEDNIYAYLADAYRYLRQQKFDGELSENDYIVRAQYWMGVNESIMEARREAEKHRSWRWPAFPKPKLPGDHFTPSFS